MVSSSLYAPGRILSFQRSKRNVKEHTSILSIDNVNTQHDVRFYLGKRVAYVYKADKAINGSKVRVMWGKITRPHGNSGKVRAKWAKNIPPKAFGAPCRIMLYPSSI
ncbi:ribosomal protein L35Ae [Caulochytrium protostelioides]|uniref:Ribosomal protein L35Ae n=1 Tax=Caulochytrium protostelioides TaxID=1555241 RepID=A0A4V1ITR6_9FUNG|nr:ribosomal protein L35Ae [Caulochytrium protostelioides]